jgi:hypothetical protein
MAKIRNCTMNFSFGRALVARLTCLRRLAFTEVHRLTLGRIVEGLA